MDHLPGLVTNYQLTATVGEANWANPVARWLELIDFDASSNFIDCYPVGGSDSHEQTSLVNTDFD